MKQILMILWDSKTYILNVTSFFIAIGLIFGTQNSTLILILKSFLVSLSIHIIGIVLLKLGIL